MPVRFALLVALAASAGCAAPPLTTEPGETDADVELVTPLFWNVTSGTGPAALRLAVDAAEATTCTTIFSMAGEAGPRGIHGGAFATQGATLVNYVYTSSTAVFTAEPRPDGPNLVLAEGGAPAYGINWQFKTVGPVELVFFGHGWKPWLTDVGEYGPLQVEIRCDQPSTLRAGAGSEVLAFHGLTLDNGTTVAASPPLGARVEAISASMNWHAREPHVTMVASSRSGLASEYAESWTAKGPTHSSTQMRPGAWSHVLHDVGGAFRFELERQRASPSTCFPPCPLLVTEPLVAVAAGHHPVSTVAEAVLAWSEGEVPDG